MDRGSTTKTWRMPILRPLRDNTRVWGPTPGICADGGAAIAHENGVQSKMGYRGQYRDLECIF